MLNNTTVKKKQIENFLKASLWQQMETGSKCLQSINYNVDSVESTVSHQQQHSGNNFSHANNTLNRTDSDLIQCPTCASQLRRCDMAEHCEQEMERLRHMKTESNTSNSEQPHHQHQGQNQDLIVEEENSERKKPWTVFQRVQRNRQSRMKLRSRKRPSVIEHACPVCNGNFPENDIQNHVENCLRRVQNERTTNGGSRRSSDEHSSNDDNDDDDIVGVGGTVGDEYEEYEWAGQKRIRVSSLLHGGYASLGIGQSITSNGSAGSASQRNNDEEDEDLNVDEDDTQIYGPAQYGENDVITPLTSYDDGCANVTSYMRHLIAASTSHQSTQNNSGVTTKNINNMHDHEIESSTMVNETMECSTLATTAINTTTTNANSDVTNGNEHLTISNSSTIPSSGGYYQQIIDSLKVKLRHYEDRAAGKYKCLICLDDYRNPAISVACWHVHCEQCWLRSLGARKLCPQCNLITTPRDLRRIYM